MKRLLPFLVLGLVVSGCALKKNGETRSNNGKKSAYFTDAVSAESESQPIDSGSVEPKISTYEVDGEIVEYTETWAGPETSEPREPVCTDQGLMLTTSCADGCRPRPGSPKDYTLTKPCPDTALESKCRASQAVYEINALCEGSNCAYRRHILESKKSCKFVMVEPKTGRGLCNTPPPPPPPPAGRLCRETREGENPVDPSDCEWPLACLHMLGQIGPCNSWRSWGIQGDGVTIFQKCEAADARLFDCLGAIQARPDCKSYDGVGREKVLNRLKEHRQECQECKDATRGRDW